MINGKCIGNPNSCPVGSDLFFEVKDAFIHIDLKTVSASNIGDYNKSIFVGRNQNSYTTKYTTQRTHEIRQYSGFLPFEYTIDENNKKPCLTYFISILYEYKSEIFSTLCINISCMSNGKLNTIYGARPIRPGKNPDKARFNFSECCKFEKLDFVLCMCFRFNIINLY